MTNNQSNELREQIENLKHKVVMGDGSEIMICEAIPKAKVDALVALIQDRELLARIDEIKRLHPDVASVTKPDYMHQATQARLVERLEQLKGGKL